jgi:predicted aspartyl protease
VDRHGGIAIDVRIDDGPSVKFILDTGAARTVIADDLARTLASRVVATSDLVTSAGTNRREVVRLTSMAVGPARAEGLLALVIPADRLSALGDGVRGLLGEDFLSAFSYTIDYRRQRLAWDAPLDCRAPDAVALVESEGRYTMALQDDRGHPLRLVPDTGTEATVLFHPDDQFEVTSGAVTLSGLARERPAQRVSARHLRIGAVVLHDVPAVLIDRPDPGVDGLMPMHGFSSVSFAASGQCLSVRK